MLGRRHKDLLLRATKALGLFRLSRMLTARGVRVLCYHAAWLEPDGYSGDSMFIRAETFERRLEQLEALGYSVISLSDAVKGLAGRRLLPENPVVITIDDGWLSTRQALLPMLARRRMPVTLYCDTANLLGQEVIANMMALHFWNRCGEERKTAAARAAYEKACDFAIPMADRIAGLEDLAKEIGVDLAPYLSNRRFIYMTPEELREASESGVDVQLHTHNHSLYDFSEEAIAREIETNREVLAKITGKPKEAFVHFCYPSGMVHEQSGARLEAVGVSSAVTLAGGLAFPGADLHYLPRITDGDQLTDLMFEAEMSGFMYIARSAAHWVKGLGKGRRRDAPVPVGVPERAPVRVRLQQS